MATGTSSQTVPWVNVYYKRATATPKPCYVCSKETTTCLATIDVSDFLYTCPSHLTDTGFAVPLAQPATKPTITQEDIDRVKAEYEEKHKKMERDKDKGKGEDDKTKTSKAKAPSLSLEKPPPPTKFALHRQFFEMRTNEWKTKQAREIAKQLPALPPSLSKKVMQGGSST